MKVSTYPDGDGVSSLTVFAGVKGVSTGRWRTGPVRRRTFAAPIRNPLSRIMGMWDGKVHAVDRVAVARFRSWTERKPRRALWHYHNRSSSPLLAGAMIGKLTLNIQRIAGYLLILFAVQAASATPSQLPDRLVVANSASWIPYSFLDQEGQPRGILVDLWRLFAAANNIEVEFTLVDWADSIALVRTGAADVHGGLIATETRKEALHFFPTEIFRIRSLVFWHEDMETRDLATLAGVRIGVVAASTEEEFLRANFSNLKIKTYPNSQQLVEAAVLGEIMSFVSDYPTGLRRY